jgi:glutamyl-tRNA synthetase
MSQDRIKQCARLYALQNAVQFNGKATSKAVVGKVIASLQDDAGSPKDIVPVVNAVVTEVNRLPLDRQIAELEQLAPELLYKEKRERDFTLPALPNAELGKVVTRFPPEPNGYLHIGHAKAAIIDAEYAHMYDGKFILRFDDTNPDNAELAFYDAQKEDLHWLGIGWDETYNTSDHLETHYTFAEQLINQGDAYVCKCASEDIKKGRFKGVACTCRSKSPGEHLDLWKEMLSSSVGKRYILRLHGDLSSANTAIRDPTLFRIIESLHPLHGDKYWVWPTYDFAGAVEDSISGVTHPFRTKEYELRDECYFYILARLNLRKPHLMEFSRLAITGMPVSKRKIKPLIDTGQVTGYDDVRLPTLRGLQRRGIVPEAIKQFVFSQGISKAESTVTFGLIEAVNRKILDPQAKRYFFVPEPMKLCVNNAPAQTVKLTLHPTAKLGERTVSTRSTFFISKQDLKKLHSGDTVRLKGLFNVKILKKTDKETTAEYSGKQILPEMIKIQWTTDKHINMQVFTPDLLFKKDSFNANSLKTVKGFAEPAVADLKQGEIVQFERFGFVRIEKQDHQIIGFLTHK